MEIFRLGDLSLLHLLIYLITNLYQYELINIYFIVWVLIQYYFILVIKFLQFWLLVAFSVGSCFPLIYSHYCGFFVCLFFCALQYAPGSSCVLLPHPRISDFSRRLGSFYYRMLLETKPSARCAHCYWGITICRLC